MFPPVETGSGESDFVIRRSAPTPPLTVVVSVSEVLPGLGSSGELAVAVLEMIVPPGVPALTFTARVIVMLEPLARVGPEQVTAPVPPTTGVVGHVQPPVALTETNVVFAGVESLRVELVAGSCPLLATVIV
jgi:hypothetical protein